MGKTDSETAARRRILRVLASNDHFLPVAAVDETIVGYAWAQNYGPHIRTGQSIVRLHDLFVAPDSRMKGVGTKLFEAVVNWAREAGAAWLQWQASRSALPFYTHLGIVPHAAEDLEHPFFEIELEQ